MKYRYLGYPEKTREYDEFFQMVLKSDKKLRNEGLSEMMIEDKDWRVNPDLFIFGTFLEDRGFFRSRERFVVELDENKLGYPYSQYVREHKLLLSNREGDNEYFLTPQQLFLYIPLIEQLFMGKKVFKAVMTLDDSGHHRKYVYP